MLFLFVYWLKFTQHAGYVESVHHWLNWTYSKQFTIMQEERPLMSESFHTL